MSEDLQRLRTIDGQRVGQFLAAREEFQRAFPSFFRAVGHEVVARLAPAAPGIAAHVGEDYRGAAVARLDNPLPPLDWVAFSFPGYAMWDLHVGVVVRLDVWPAKGQVGVHWTSAVAREISPLVQAVDWGVAVGQGGELAESLAVREIQQRDVAEPLDVNDLADEALWYAERAIRYYSVMRPLLARRAAPGA